MAVAVAAAIGKTTPSEPPILISVDEHPLHVTEEDREFLADIIYDISPADTPFCSWAKKTG